MTALAYALQLLTALPGLIAAGVEVTQTIERARDKIALFKIEGRDPTPEEWDELDAEVKRLRGELHAGESGTAG